VARRVWTVPIWTYTNILGKDRDLGYEIMRIDPDQKWYPFYLLQPNYNIVLAALFEWGVAVHDLDFDAIRKGEKSKARVRKELKGIAGKARSQILERGRGWAAGARRPADHAYHDNRGALGWPCRVRRDSRAQLGMVSTGRARCRVMERRDKPA
jgi:hypothetical protein